MGGNAFNHKGYQSQRMNKEEYHLLQDEIFGILTELGLEYKEIFYVREKESFGDIDVIVVKQDGPNVKDILVNNIDKFGLTEEFVFKNKDVISILFKEKYQVDFIFTKDKDKDYHQLYLSHNDLGNLLGRIIKQSGFQHGHNGLFYVYREGNHYKHLIPLTNDYYRAIEILGLDVEKFKQGFDTFKEMFDFVTSSKYFKKSRFALENLNNRNRVRDRKRKVYNNFLEYIKTIPDGVENVPSPFVEFPWLEDVVNKIKAERAVHNAFAEKFNGNKVHQWTGLSGGKENGHVFGKFMGLVKSQPDFEDTVNNSTEEELKAYVMRLYEEFKALN